MHQLICGRDECKLARKRARYEKRVRRRKAPKPEGPFAPPHFCGSANKTVATPWAADLLRRIDEKIPTRPPFFPSKAILDAFSEATGFPVKTIVGRRRDARTAAVRHLAIYKIRTTLGWSFLRIAKIFGRDHSTIIASVRCVEAALEGAR